VSLVFHRAYACASHKAKRRPLNGGTQQPGMQEGKSSRTAAPTLDPAGGEKGLSTGSCVPAAASGSDDAFEICSSAAAVAVLRGSIASRACRPARLICVASAQTWGGWAEAIAVQAADVQVLTHRAATRST